MKHPRANNGSVLVGILWCMALLSVVVVGSLYTSRIDLTSTKLHGDRIQAYYLALAGVETAKALIYEDAKDRSQRSTHHSGALYEDPSQFQDIPFSRGTFRVGHAGKQNPDGIWTFGIRDEEGRLNINTASTEELAKLPGSSESIAAAIVDFRDNDDQVTPGGAESDTYASLTPPYLPRNGPFKSVDELRMVYGISPSMVVGEDSNRNMILDPEENDGETSEPMDNQDGRLDLGWSEWLTAHSAMANTTASGDTRISIQEADETELTEIPGITTDLAESIVKFREDNEFQTIASLLDVVQVSDDDDDDNNGRGGGSASGEKLISTSEFISMSDYVTVGTDTSLPGRININTAPEEILTCLPGMTRELAHAVVNYRSSSGYFDSVGAVLNVPGMTTDIFKQLCPRIGVRSDTFRILSEGRITSTGAKKQIEMIVRVEDGTITTLAYREYP
ncbi:MAG: type II secretion system protein GspK [Verrucomicrobia bacterium]|nr:type II secretion system protein GspK [Verrucomicrobiota bacterium]